MGKFLRRRAMMQAVGHSGPLYPIPNGGSVGNVMVTDGNTFDATSSNGLATYFGLYHRGRGSANAISNKATKFTIPAGAEAVLTVTVTSSTKKDDTNAAWNSGFVQALGSTKKQITTNLTGPGVRSGSFTPEADFAVGELYLYSPAVKNIKGHVELWVNGEQWI